ncbi:MAG TPA: co-chaperone DjlA [Gammaproteobacteria bacterium]|nr:co-chaperone DjlA [Gammaproteobacteria bacterium]
MIIWGKIFGAILGFLAYGPPGLILGVVFGQIFDKALYNFLHSPKHAASVRMVFFKTVFQTMGYLAKADGVVSEREVQVARDIMLHDFNLDKRQMLMAIGFFNEGKSPDFNMPRALSKFKAVCTHYSDLRKFFLELVVKASLADKVLRNDQRVRLIFICNSLGIQLSELEYQLRIYGFSSSYYHGTNQRQYNANRSYNSYSGSSQSASDADPQLTAAYNLLGVKSTDNIKIIKGAYRRLMSKYHPDKLVAKGLPPEMMDIAKEKTQQVAAAYALIMRSRR